MAAINLDRQDGGYYNLFGAKPVAVVRLQQPASRFPAGAELLWITGERNWHSPDGILGPKEKTGLLRLAKFDIEPIETFFNSHDGFVDGINFGHIHPSENGWIQYKSANFYLQERTGGELARTLPQFNPNDKGR